ncbi:hypothetical protein BDV06DRAFT_134398 [Aspergillus oleicola]
MDIGAMPVIFVVQLLGGLIVKMAYIQGLYDPEYKPIVSAISSIVFLATPHRGSGFAETLNKVLKATMIKPPRQFVNDLAKNSSTLLKLNEEFWHFAPRVGLASFYETRTRATGTDRVQIMVVNPDSATLGYPGETSASMDADHHTICKYESQRNPNYLKARNYIKSRVSSILQSQRSKKSHSPHAEDALKREKAADSSQPWRRPRQRFHILPRQVPAGYMHLNPGKSRISRVGKLLQPPSPCPVATGRTWSRKVGRRFICG